MEYYSTFNQRYSQLRPYPAPCIKVLTYDEQICHVADQESR